MIALFSSSAYFTVKTLSCTVMNPVLDTTSLLTLHSTGGGGGAPLEVTHVAVPGASLSTRSVSGGRSTMAVSARTGK